MTTVQAKGSGSGGRICVAVAAGESGAAIAAVRPLLDAVDVVEIRLDAMVQADIGELCRQIPKPLLFTNRPVWEGGACSDPETERLKPLLAAVEAGAAFVDLELRADVSLRELLLAEMRDTATRLIISYHDFSRTPTAAELSAILQDQTRSGAHIGKIVTMAHDHLDVLRVLNLQTEAQKHDFPLIAFCMGEAGRISRIITLLLGGFMTYAALDERQATAPGQLTVGRLKEALALLAATGPAD